MSYIEQFEAELARKIESAEETASIVRWTSEKVLESYRNGITAGQKGVTVKRQVRAAVAASTEKPNSRMASLSAYFLNHMYNVISPDGFPMTCEPFPTEQAAIDAIPLLCKRYERQGYYSTARLHRIPLDELPDYIYVREA